MAMALNARWKKAQILSKKRMKDNGKFGYTEPPTMILTGLLQRKPAVMLS